jgi:hypothetical protein
MRTIIAGSRSCDNPQELLDAIAACGWRPSVVLSGRARGADTLGEQWAADNGIPCEHFTAYWEFAGRRAGYARNERMAASAEALIALWDNNSPGTGHMIDIANRRGLRVYVHTIEGEGDGGRNSSGNIERGETADEGGNGITGTP